MNAVCWYVINYVPTDHGALFYNKIWITFKTKQMCNRVYK